MKPYLGTDAHVYDRRADRLRLSYRAKVLPRCAGSELMFTKQKVSGNVPAADYRFTRPDVTERVIVLATIRADRI